MAIRKVKMDELKEVAASLKNAAELLDEIADEAIREGAGSLYLQADWLINTAEPQLNEKIVDLNLTITGELTAIKSGRQSPGERKFKRAKQRRKAKGAI